MTGPILTSVDQRPPAAPPVSAPAETVLRVNGVTHRVPADARTTVLDALREHLRLTGTKKGCDHGQCGACTVHVNGRRVLACLSLAVAHQDDEIRTIEGVADDDGSLHPVQRNFLACDALQCGFCTPGQIMSAIALIAESAAGQAGVAAPAATGLSDDDIRERMSGNICRCGAYPNIVAAVRRSCAPADDGGTP